VGDLSEGNADADGDRIPDYLDNSNAPNELPVNTDSGSTNQVISSPEPGVQLVLGDIAFAVGSSDATISVIDIMDFGDGGSAVANGDDEGQYFPSGVVDFEVHNVTVGSSVYVIIPQASPIPANAVYRKYAPVSGWVDFVVDANNTIASAQSAAGVCPSVDNSLYTSGLTEGHDCVRLLIQDGGINDSDGLVNGVIKDPGGVSVEVVVTANRSTASTKTNFTNGSGEQIVMSFVINNNAGDAELSGLTLQTNGSLDDTADISNVSIYLDADNDGVADTVAALATGNYSEDDGTLIFTFSAPYDLAIGSTQFLVTYEF
jgi:hypothetical protein